MTGRVRYRRPGERAAALHLALTAAALCLAFGFLAVVLIMGGGITP